MNQQPKIAFFGTPQIAVWVLEELEAAGIVPDIVVTNPDRKTGRKHEYTETPVKAWAKARNIEVLTPASLTEGDLGELTSGSWDLFVVVAYGVIMPKWFIDLPKHGTINMHPSLLPKLRGASPIRSSILHNYAETGVSVMLMDEKMDHGPLLAQVPFEVQEPLRGSMLDTLLAHEGGKLLAQVIPKWLNGEIVPQEQNHAEATYAKKFTTSDAELFVDPFNLPSGEAAQKTLLKIYAYEGNPGAYFFHNKKRIKITDAHLDGDKLVITRVVPEGKKEMSFAEYLSSHR